MSESFKDYKNLFPQEESNQMSLMYKKKRSPAWQALKESNAH
jgi:hypothetical protein